VFDAPLHKKGQGAQYARKINRLSPIHIEIIKLLEANQAFCSSSAIPKQTITSQLKTRADASGGRLSELLGLGFIEMCRKKIELQDQETMKFRFRKTPCWFISERFREGRIGYHADGTIVYLQNLLDYSGNSAPQFGQ
jgi:hypothetical protein